MTGPEAPKDKGLVADAAVQNMMGRLLKEFYAKYPDAMSREPTAEELQYLFNQGFRAGMAGELYGAPGFNGGPARKSILSEPQKWALATSAIPKKASELELDILGGGEAAPDYVEAIQEMLEEDWEIRDSSDALDIIGWLKYTGHRQEFDLMLKEVSTLEEEDFIRVVNSYEDEPGLQKQLRLVRSKMEASDRKKSIIGWDYCRLVYVAECCGRAGYLTEDEAWREIMPTARAIQSTFSSWKGMSDNYLLGRKFWSGGSEPRITTAVKFLLSDPGSPWVRYAWNLPLD